MFEHNSTKLYSDIQITAWLKELGYLTAKDRSFIKDSVRGILCNPYFVGKIRYRSMIVRLKGVSFRSIPPMVSEGHTNHSSVMIYGGTPRQCAPAAV